jgi:hypothetical protein
MEHEMATQSLRRKPMSDLLAIYNGLRSDDADPATASDFKGKGNLVHTINGMLKGEDLSDDRRERERKVKANREDAAKKEAEAREEAEDEKPRPRKVVRRKSKVERGRSASIGARVYSDEYGEAYPGTIVSGRGAGFTVEFDDGDTGIYPPTDIHLIARKPKRIPIAKFVEPLLLDPTASYSAILREVHAAYEGARTTVNNLRWYASQMRGRDVILPDRPREPKAES